MELNVEGIIGTSPVLKEVFRILAKVAPTDSTVLVTGESGTGKELLVRALHRSSQRRDQPFVPINCGAIPRELLESELFGHEKGAFTHAVRTRPGRFELAQGGTVFLDEIGEMDLSLQVKILRVLQEKEFEKVGGTKTQKADVRVVAATNRDLEREVAEGRFREDLFYRLNVIPLHLPPLRERGEDVLLLAEFFLRRFCGGKGRSCLGLSPEAREMLRTYQWPGNVRELENFMERMAILCEGESITPEDLPEKIWRDAGRERPPPPPAPATPQGFVWPVLQDLRDKGLGLKEFLDTVEERLLLEALNESGGVKNQAAELLGIKRTTLIEKLKKRKLDNN
ncbi:sigma54 specific transcriptional regulator, Fis family [Alkalidesulfovibrio alkalitolerans DSM 16529]|uniref:Sigma54 specific transcriptional regulator, Fis family n=1 Tax=Alkalidesulfovibrio alkalitolerans DSM 16529 TaxID=1121439 RepID=S7TEH2_9BACT|nr:sigma-54 dependent transcriptional regulator [Alkalidesulfovibrio alkalitolerans]EPR34985.1 sigma54 specific transcriptional regulator, Fis family [Alkalidesulfovibrio alkalitolerans DSM 16529]